MTDAVFRMTTICDNPLFEGFGIPVRDLPSQLGRRNLAEDVRPGFGRVKGSEWTQTSLAATWRPPPTEGRVALYNDFPCINLTFPAFSRRAIQVLGLMLSDNGELLPLDAHLDEPYYFYNITRISDSLDVQRSDCIVGSRTGRIIDVDRFVFHPSRVDGLSVCRVHQLPMDMLVSQRFVDRVAETGLNGFSFSKVWAPDWDPDAPRRPEAPIEFPAADKQSLVRETLVVLFPLSGVHPSSEEEKTLAVLGDQVDETLAVSSLDQPFVGCYQRTELQPNEFRMVLSTPDCQNLAAKLTPWLSNLNWGATVRLLKREGTIYEVGGSEEPIHEVP